jgi:DNA-directed RNA polymerase subunit RPC12/RpoP
VNKTWVVGQFYSSELRPYARRTIQSAWRKMNTPLTRTRCANYYTEDLLTLVRSHFIPPDIFGHWFSLKSLTNSSTLHTKSGEPKVTQTELVAQQSRQVRNRVRAGLCLVAAGAVTGFAYSAYSSESTTFWALAALTCFIYPVGVMYEAATAPKCPNCSHKLSLYYCAIAVATQRCGRCGQKLTEDSN